MEKWSMENLYLFQVNMLVPLIKWKEKGNFIIFFLSFYSKIMNEINFVRICWVRKWKENDNNNCKQNASHTGTIQLVFGRMFNLWKNILYSYIQQQQKNWIKSMCTFYVHRHMNNLMEKLLRLSICVFFFFFVCFLSNLIWLLLFVIIVSCQSWYRWFTRAVSYDLHLIDCIPFFSIFNFSVFVWHSIRNELRTRSRAFISLSFFNSKKWNYLWNFSWGLLKWRGRIWKNARTLQH